MGNFILNSTARYTPFSFEEKLKPVAIYTDAYNKIEEGIGALSTKAGVWEKLANDVRDKDSKAYKQYKAYSDELNKAAEDLAKNGLNPSSKQTLLTLQKTYNNSISPIEEAYLKREQEVKNQLEGRAKGLVYEGDASLASIDRYLDNPNAVYGFADSTAGAKRVALAATALQKELRNYGSGKKLNAYTNTWLQQHGYTKDEINTAINDIQEALQGRDNIRGNGILQSILAQEMQTSGVGNWTNKDAQIDYFNRIAPSLYSAIGQTNVGTYEDYDAKLNAQMRAQAAKAAKDKRDSIPILISNLYSKREQEKAAKNIKDYSQYFKTLPNGQIVLTPEGEAEYKKVTDNNWGTYSGLGIGKSYINNNKVSKEYSDFRKFMDTLGVDPKIENSIGNAWAKYLKDNDHSKYDATKITEYTVNVEDTDAVRDFLISNSSKGELKEIDFNSKKGAFEETGESIKTSDLLDKNKYKILPGKISEYGSTVEILDIENNKIMRVKMPNSGDPRESRREMAFEEQVKLRKLLENPNLSKEDRMFYENMYINFQREAIQNHLGLFGAYNLKPSDVNFMDI